MTVPPFGDLGTDREDLVLSSTTIIDHRASNFFGGRLRWWIAVSGEDIVAGALGAPPAAPDVTLDVDYPSYLDARLGRQPWRHALTSGQWRIEGSLPDILHAATIAQGVTTPDEPLAPHLRWASTVCNRLAHEPPDPAPELIADPKALWPDIDPWARVDLIQVALAVPGLHELPVRKLRLELDGTWTDGWIT